MKRRPVIRAVSRSSRAGRRCPGRVRRIDDGSAAEHRLLGELARRFGIQQVYQDMAGNSRRVAADTLRAILRLDGIPVGSRRELEDALRQDRRREWEQVLPPVAVIWQGKAGKVRLRVPAQATGSPLSLRLHEEDGQQRRFRMPLEPGCVSGRNRLEGQEFAEYQVALPSLAPGYHELEVELGNRAHRCLLIAAPAETHGFEADDQAWGLFVPPYALHSKRSWGAGSLGEWRRFSAWMRSLGGTVAATLPLLARFHDRPLADASPYSPVSRLFWDEFYLDIERIPEFAACAPAQHLANSARFRRSVKRFRKHANVDYPAEMRARRAVLQSLSDGFFSQRSSRFEAFERFLQERPAAVDYAEFRAATEQQRQPWRRWEARMRQGKLQPGDFALRTKQYHLYVQWLASEQMQDLAGWSRRKGIQLYLDLPLGTHPDGFDLWREREAFASAATTGAPPDQFFRLGQNWGFFPPHPRRCREQGYRHLREILHFHMQHASLLRIDHILGLHRLYWIPAGHAVSEGAYVRYPAEELYAVLCVESHRHRTVVVGENLGTVPSELALAMRKRKIPGLYVLQFEQTANPARALKPPPRRAVGSFNTHDTPPFAAHCAGLDLEEQAAWGGLTATTLLRSQRLRKRLMAALVRYLRRTNKDRPGLEGTAEIYRASLRWLGASRLGLVIANLEDLWGEERRQNLPGTSAGALNWRRKTRLTLERIQKSGRVAQLLCELNCAREVSLEHTNRKHRRRLAIPGH
jgi:4-alpha-glucanotransferase